MEPDDSASVRPAIRKQWATPGKRKLATAAPLPAAVAQRVVVLQPQPQEVPPTTTSGEGIAEPVATSIAADRQFSPESDYFSSMHPQCLQPPDVGSSTREMIWEAPQAPRGQEFAVPVRADSRQDEVALQSVALPAVSIQSSTIGLRDSHEQPIDYLTLQLAILDLKKTRGYISWWPFHAAVLSDLDRTNVFMRLRRNGIAYVNVSRKVKVHLALQMHYLLRERISASCATGDAQHRPATPTRSTDAAAAMHLSRATPLQSDEHWSLASQPARQLVLQGLVETAAALEAVGNLSSRSKGSPAPDLNRRRLARWFELFFARIIRPIRMTRSRDQFSRTMRSASCPLPDGCFHPDADERLDPPRTSDLLDIPRGLVTPARVLRPTSWVSAVEIQHSFLNIVRLLDGGQLQLSTDISTIATSPAMHPLLMIPETSQSLLPIADFPETTLPPLSIAAIVERATHR
ncbi:hypothetical protein BKA62DRAFT_677744 [Auriculariales sp. MPI-PUGE-AT-0066]|nr:hypothetical protein BKA62DRAFT_677744 [Auriculariales sp. MPI-PUGE-AT-0066]